MQSKREKVIIAWSGGKDSALALYKLQLAYRYDVVALLVNVLDDTQRVTTHEVPATLIGKQADAIGLKIHSVEMPPYATNTEYEHLLDEALNDLRIPGCTQVAYGDIFLEDVKKYREDHLARSGFKGVYPLWGRETGQLAHEFIDLGFKAITVAVDLEKLNESFIGRKYDEKFLADLPSNVDPCGENGEFHTFVYAGPNFRYPIEFKIGGGPYVRDERFGICDLEG
jgi:uncharacterized protein (TIGR00290 family)